MTPPLPILYADDDENDSLLIKLAFKNAGVGHPLTIVPDGKSAIHYLSGKPPYQDRNSHPLPALLLLDIKMPGVSGLEVLKWVRSQPMYCTLPVVMLTSSAHDADVHRAYLMGANGYLVKPSKMDEMVKMAKAINDFWLALNHRPPIDGKS